MSKCSNQIQKVQIGTWACCPTVKQGYPDDYYEYRHVVLPKDIYKKIQGKGKLLSEQEWRALGVQQSRGWVHYEIHKPEQHILLFRRAKGSDPITGQPPANFNPPPDNY